MYRCVAVSLANFSSDVLKSDGRRCDDGGIVVCIAHSVFAPVAQHLAYRISSAFCWCALDVVVNGNTVLAMSFRSLFTFLYY